MLIYDKFTPLALENFQKNGNGYLTDFKSVPTITKEQFPGTFKLEFDYAINGLNAEYIEQFAYIKADFDGSDQLFQIQSAEKTLSAKTIHVYALHVFFMLNNNFLADVRPTNLSAPEAIRYVLANAQYNNPFTVIGQSSTISTAYYERKTITEAISTADNSIINRWGVEIDVDNFIIRVADSIGNDNGTFLSYAKNLTEVIQYIDISEMATRLMPVGFDGITLPELYVDSENINNYPIPIIKTLDVDVAIDEDTTEQEAYEIMRQACLDWFENGGDKPLMNFTVDFVELSKMPQYYEKYSVLERVRLGDYVTVQVWNMNIKMRVISVQYDCFSKRYISIQLGNARVDYFKQQNKAIEKVVNTSSKSTLEQAKEQATSLINNVSGGYVLKRNGELLIMDTENPNTATKVWRWNLNGLAYSSTGTNGPYNTAMTMDGSIVADFITAGKINTDLIEGYNEVVIKTNSVDNKIKEIQNSVETAVGTVETLSGTVTDMSFNFSTKGLNIGTSSDPNNSLLDNTGIKVYNYEKLNAIFNDKGSGVKKLIVTETAQIGYLKFIKAVYNNESVTEIYHLKNLVEQLEDLEVDSNG